MPGLQSDGDESDALVRRALAGLAGADKEVHHISAKIKCEVTFDSETGQWQLCPWSFHIPEAKHLEWKYGIQNNRGVLSPEECPEPQEQSSSPNE